MYFLVQVYSAGITPEFLIITDSYSQSEIDSGLLYRNLFNDLHCHLNDSDLIRILNFKTGEFFNEFTLNQLRFIAHSCNK